MMQINNKIYILNEPGCHPSCPQPPQEESEKDYKKPVLVVQASDRFNINSQLEHLQAKYVGTGHADVNRL